MHILVFCTDVRRRGDLNKLKPALDALPEVVRWTIDLEDCDRVLRIVTRMELMPELVLTRMAATGFRCTVMD
jgi:hypothetical protein